MTHTHTHTHTHTLSLSNTPTHEHGRNTDSRQDSRKRPGGRGRQEVWILFRIFFADGRLWLVRVLLSYSSEVVMLLFFYRFQPAHTAGMGHQVYNILIYLYILFCSITKELGRGKGGGKREKREEIYMLRMSSCSCFSSFSITNLRSSTCAEISANFSK